MIKSFIPGLIHFIDGAVMIIIIIKILEAGYITSTMARLYNAIP